MFIFYLKIPMLNVCSGPYRGSFMAKNCFYRKYKHFGNENLSYLNLSRCLDKYYVHCQNKLSCGSNDISAEPNNELPTK